MREAASAPDRSALGLPNLLIVGAAKCGTSALHAYLDHHPDIFMSRRKELQFFNHDRWRERIGWYREQFRSDAPVRGESSPAYSMDPWFPDVPERARELVPDARVVYLVRDPVARAVAQYVEHVAVLIERRPIADALSDFDSSDNRYVMASRYSHQIDRWRASFPDAQILVVDQRDLLESRAATLREVFAFVGADPGFTTAAFDRLHNERSTKLRTNGFGHWLHERGQLKRLRRASRPLPDAVREPLKRIVASPMPAVALDEDLRRKLEHALHDDAERLRAYTGKPFAHWSV
jgi:hypothetical protein